MEVNSKELDENVGNHDVVGELVRAVEHIPKVNEKHKPSKQRIAEFAKCK